MNRSYFLSVKALQVSALVTCLLIFTQSINAQERASTQVPSPSPTSISPDDKWEYKLVEGSRPGIVRAGTSEVVLNLSQFAHPPEASEVVWAPDSTRFAFNYQAGTRYQTTQVYQRDGEKWQELDSPESDATAARIGKPGQPIITSYQIRKWLSPSTALLYAHNETKEGSASFFFTLKFDPRGNWKIVRTREVRAKGSIGLNKIEQEEIKRIRKEQDQETSTIGDHIYHHQP